MIKCAALAVILILSPLFQPGSYGANRGQSRLNGDRQTGGLVLPIIKRDSLLNGLQVIVLEHPGTGSVAVRLRINRGALFDLAGKNGLADITAGMLLKGGGGLTAKNVAETVEQSGFTLSIVVDWDWTDLVISGPADTLEGMVDLLNRLVVTPAFDAKELDALKAARIAAIKGEAVSDAEWVARRALETAYGTSPFSRLPRGTPESIPAITRADLVYFHNRFYLANNATLLVTGDATAEQVTRLARSKLGGWKKGELVPATFRLSEPHSERRIVILDRPDAQAAQAAIAQVGVSRRASDYLAARVMTEVLGAMNAKQAAGAGRSVETLFDSRYIAGPILIKLQSPPDEVGDAIDRLLAAMTSLKTAQPPLDLVESAKSRVIGSFSESLRSPEGVADIILDIELYGLGRDYLITFADRVNAITPDDIRRAAQTYLSPQSVAIAVAGPASRLEGPLKRLGQVTVGR